MRAIQDLLGEHVGTLTAGGTAGTPTLTLSNAPDGSGGNVEPSAAAVASAANASRGVSQGYAGQPAVTLSLSPAAQHVLSQDQIALSVLLGKKAESVQTVSVPSAASQAQPSSDKLSSAQAGPSVASQISSIIAQKRAELDGPNGIYTIASAQEVADAVTFGLSDQSKAAFQQAYANHSL